VVRRLRGVVFGVVRRLRGVVFGVVRRFREIVGSGGRCPDDGRGIGNPWDLPSQGSEGGEHGLADQLSFFGGEPAADPQTSVLPAPVDPSPATCWRLFSGELPVARAVAPTDPLQLRRSREFGQLDELRLVLRGGDPGHRSDLGVAQPAIVQRRVDPGQSELVGSRTVMAELCCRDVQYCAAMVMIL